MFWIIYSVYCYKSTKNIVCKALLDLDQFWFLIGWETVLAVMDSKFPGWRIRARSGVISSLRCKASGNVLYSAPPTNFAA